MATDIAALKNFLRPWMNRDDWESDRRADLRRFYCALRDAFAALGTDITDEEFSEAMDELAAELHPEEVFGRRVASSDAFIDRAVVVAEFLGAIR
jgi:hypothetical protein